MPLLGLLACYPLTFDSLCQLCDPLPCTHLHDPHLKATSPHVSNPQQLQVCTCRFSSNNIYCFVLEKSLSTCDLFIGTFLPVRVPAPSLRVSWLWYACSLPDVVDGGCDCRTLVVKQRTSKQNGLRFHCSFPRWSTHQNRDCVHAPAAICGG